MMGVTEWVEISSNMVDNVTITSVALTVASLMKARSESTSRCKHHGSRSVTVFITPTIGDTITSLPRIRGTFVTFLVYGITIIAITTIGYALTVFQEQWSCTR